jgi:hypothetical protein
VPGGPRDRWQGKIHRIDANLQKILPLLRPEAQTVVTKQGYLSNRRRLGLPMLRVVNEWCVFFSQGCVLHKIGAAEGNHFRYKLAACALFPLAKDENDRWYVRQHGYKAEKWDLFCLSRDASSVPAAESLQAEMELADGYDSDTAAAIGSV